MKDAGLEKALLIEGGLFEDMVTSNVSSSVVVSVHVSLAVRVTVFVPT